MIEIVSDEPIPEWERELLESQDAQNRRDDTERLGLLSEVEAEEVSWLSGGVRITLTSSKGRKPLRELLDEVRRMVRQSGGESQ